VSDIIKAIADLIKYVASMSESSIDEIRSLVNAELARPARDDTDDVSDAIDADLPDGG
jgi:hypothetical protein